MMKGISFGKNHTYDDWNLVLVKKVIGLPTPKVSSVEVEGADGYIDTSEVLAGEIKFNNRTLAFEFTMMDDYEFFEERVTEIANYLHGKKMRIILDDDEDYYYYGRCAINEWTSEKRMGKIVISCDCEPYKISLRPTVVNAKINGNTQVKIYNTRKTVTPVITCNTNTVKLTINKETFNLSKGDNIVSELFLYDGINALTFSGVGNVTITFTGGEL